MDTDATTQKRQRDGDASSDPSVPTPGVCEFERIPKDVVAMILERADTKRVYCVCKWWLDIQLTLVSPPGGLRRGENGMWRFGEGLRRALIRGNMEYYEKWSALCKTTNVLGRSCWRPIEDGNAFLLEVVLDKWHYDEKRVAVLHRLLGMSDVVDELRTNPRMGDVLVRVAGMKKHHTLELLLPHVDAEVMQKYGTAALNAALDRRRFGFGALKALMEHGAVPDERVLFVACNDSIDLVTYLLQNYGHLDPNTAIDYAIKRDSVDLMALLLRDDRVDKRKLFLRVLAHGRRKHIAKSILKHLDSADMVALLEEAIDRTTPMNGDNVAFFLGQ